MRPDREPARGSAPDRNESEKFNELTDRLREVPKDELEEAKRKERERKDREKE